MAAGVAGPADADTNGVFDSAGGCTGTGGLGGAASTEGIAVSRAELSGYGGATVGLGAGVAGKEDERAAAASSALAAATDTASGEPDVGVGLAAFASPRPIGGGRIEAL